MNDTKPFGVETTLSDVCTNITYGYTASATSENTGVKFLRITDIVPSRIDWESVPFCKISPSDLDKYQIREGDIVIARTGATTGYNKTIKQLPYPAVYASYLIKYDLDRLKADSAFVGYVLQASNWYEYVDAIAGGSAQPGANAKQLGSYPFILPSLPEQKAIASVLSSLDDKIDLLHRQNKTLEAMAETLFRQWFIEEAKEDWDEVTVSSLFEVRDGTHDSPKQSPIGYPLVTSKHIGDGVLDFDSCYLISSDDYDKVNARSKVETGDILLSMIGTLGRTYLECDEVNYAIKNIGLFKTSQNPVWKYFIYLWLNSVQGKQFVDEHKSGSTQEYLSLGSLRGIQLKSPPNDLLLIFNAKVDNWFKKIHANTKQIQTLENLRDTLLPKLMSGEVRVQYQTEQVA